MKYYLLIILYLSLTACKPGTNAAENIVHNLIGREFWLPNTTSYILRGDTVDHRSNDLDFTILTYIDPKGCTPCKMKLSFWQALMSDIEKSDSIKVGFLMAIAPTNEQDAIKLTIDEKFNLPILIDYFDSIYIINQIPNEPKYHTFLLDEDNHILAIGNPVQNPKIRDIYEKIINGGPKSSTSIHPNKYTSFMGTMGPNQEANTTFTFINESDYSISIRNILTSCGCINYSLDDDTLPPFGTTNLNVSFLNDSTPGEFAHEILVYFDNNDYLPLNIKGYIKN